MKEINKPTLTLEKITQDGWVDLYVRGRLDSDQQQAFELFMLDNNAVQEQVQLALVLKTGLSEIPKGELKGESSGTESRRKWLGGLLPTRWTAIGSAVFASAALFAFALLFSSQMTNTQLRQQLDELRSPQTMVSSAVIPHVRSTVGGDFEAMSILEKNGDDSWLVLTLELSLPEHDQYHVSILSIPDQKLVETVPPVRPDANANLVFALHSSRIPAGDYIARVADDDNQNKLVAEYAFTILEGTGQ